ncbi:MAG: divergent PAP2 family protein [Candidatus Saccharimonas aalborgensis]
MEQIVSPYILAIVSAWVLAHIIKYSIARLRGKRLDLTHQLFISGGMPSSHAATSVAVWAVVLLREGYRSAIFGLATLVVLIVCYDAVKVRRSVGEQGNAIQEIIKKTNVKVNVPRSAQGHTPLEVIAGSILGCVIGLVVFIATK